MIKASDLTKSHYKSGELARLLHVSTRTVMRLDGTGALKFDRTPGGRRVIARESLLAYLEGRGLLLADSGRIDVVYARVSTQKQKARGDLTRQIEAVATFAATRNPVNLELLHEVGSGLNDSRIVLRRLLQRVMRGEIARIFVNDKDRLTRFGFNYIEVMCKMMGTEIVIVSSEVKEKSVQEELAEDLCAVIHSFSGKLYGMRKTVGKKIDSKVNALYKGENGKD